MKIILTLDLASLFGSIIYFTVLWDAGKAVATIWDKTFIFWLITIVLFVIYFYKLKSHLLSKANLIY